MYKLILFILVIMLGAAAIMWWFSGQPTMPDEPIYPGDLPDGWYSGAVNPTANTIPVRTSSGSIEVTNITRLPEVQDVGSGMYHLQGTTYDRDEAFAFLYSAVDNSFSVSIEAEPIALQRQRASEYFLELFGVTQAEACQLKVFVGVPFNVNETFAGVNLGLSFCPGSVAL